MDSGLSAAVWPFLGTSDGFEKPFMTHFPAVPRFAAGGLAGTGIALRDRIGFKG
jgi:hypothetical protein